MDPSTAATFRVLETFQLLNFTSKISGWEFYRAIARQSDNTGTCPPPVRNFCTFIFTQLTICFEKERYEIFMRIVRQWRHIRQLKRSGRGHDPTGSAGTSEGECAILCPACPQPGINLPNNWENATPDKA